MRYLVLSDIHANLEAFQKCLEAAARKYDKVVCLGDVVGYGPDPNAVIDLLRPASCATIRGNHDKACCGITNAEDFNLWARQAVLWTREVLTIEHTVFLRQLDPGPCIMPGFELVHGSEGDEDEYITSAAEAVPALRGQRLQLVFFGHTHHQGGFSLNSSGVFREIGGRSQEDGCVLRLELEAGTRYLINPGSIGQPRDGDWRAAFAILDEEQRRVEFYRASYDLSQTQQKMIRAGLPEPLIQRLDFGR